MRIALSGSIVPLPPLILKFEESTTWDPSGYVTAGYTNFDVICIGGAGGRGGGYDGVDSNYPTKRLKSFGGAGGGGGFHRVQGLLAALSGSVDVVVGAAGADGTDLLTDSGVDFDIATTDGEDGETSSFYAPACLASGGNGGKRVYSATKDISPNCDGGDGGLGGISEHGWGGKGGIAGTFADLGPDPGTPGDDGPLFYGPFEYTVGFFTASGLIGKGGGGGAGGVGDFVIAETEGITRIESTPGGRGAYDLSDQSVYGPGGITFRYPTQFSTAEIGPGAASGARTTPLDGTNVVFGRSLNGQELPGVVVVRLTAEEG